MENRHIFIPIKKKKNRKYIPFFILPVILTFIFIMAFAGKKGEAEVKEDEVKYLGRSQLKSITPVEIANYDLTLDWELQHYISEISRKYKIDFGAVVVMDADNGDILALWGRESKSDDCSIPMHSYLAASIFKIVTASAAIERGMTPLSTVTYNGNPWTIYKGQLKDDIDKWTQQITFSHAFAQSNNVVFAKLGVSLGEGPLLLNAMKYGFWKAPMRECWSMPSKVMIPESEYNLGELACGLNHVTEMSPVHAAQIVTPVLNKGMMVTPRLIKTMPEERVRVIDEKIAEDLYSMMEATIKSGTFSKRFKISDNDGVLKELTIGAKSGSINSREPEGRLNWFVGYADHPVKGKIVIASLLLRDAQYWIKSDEFAKMIIRKHFEQPFLGKASESENTLN